MREADFSDSVYECLRVLRESIERAISDGSLRLFEEEYMVDWCADPESDKPGHTIEIRTEKRRVPGIMELHNLVEKLLAEDEIVQSALGMYTESRQDIEKAQAEFTFSQVVRSVARQMIGGESTSAFSNEHLLEIADEIANELANDTRSWTVTAFIEGMTIKEAISVGNLFSLRRVRVKETLREIPYGELPIRSIGDRFQIRNPEVGTTALEVSSVQTDHQGIQKSIINHLRLLRLYRVGTVTFFRMDFIPASYHCYSSSQGTPHSTHLKIPYEFSQEDVGSFLEFETEFSSFIETIIEGANPRLGSLSIGLSRYDSALLESSKYPTRIVNSISALEALLLSDSSELSYKLRMRSAALLGCEGYDPVHARECVKECYDIRSKYMHGKPLDSSVNLQMKSSELLDIVRKVLMLTLRARKSMSHEDFLTLIDDALVDKKKKSELTEKVSPPSNP